MLNTIQKLKLWTIQLMTFINLKDYYYDLKNYLYTIKLRRRVKNKSFTIISNNCWGGTVYEDLQLMYNTPTIGLFFFAPCYITFLKNLEKYLNTPLTFKNTSKYPTANNYRMKRNRYYPIGVLDDIEIQFLHYKSESEAIDKWNRRSKRINFHNLLISFTDQDCCTYELMKEFDELDFSNKVLFSASNQPEFKSLIWLKEYQGQPHIGDIATHKWGYRRYFDVANWLNKAI